MDTKRITEIVVAAEEAAKATTVGTQFLGAFPEAEARGFTGQGEKGLFASIYLSSIYLSSLPPHTSITVDRYGLILSFNR